MSNKTFLVVVIFLVLVQLTTPQRGRGRSSFSRGSFGGGFSRGFSGNSYHSTNYYGGSYYGGYYGSGYSGRPASPGVVWGIIGGIAGIFALCCCCAWWRNRRNNSLDQDPGMIEPMPMQMQMQTPIAVLKDRYYSMVGGMLGPDEFGVMAMDFENMLREVTFNRKRFVYTQEYIQKPLILYGVVSRRHSPLICQLSIRGEDQMGPWGGEGAFMMTGGGPFFWMAKIYDDRDRAGQTEEWSTLIYESLQMGNGWCDGRWFFQNMQDSYDSAGTWRIA